MERGLLETRGTRSRFSPPRETLIHGFAEPHPWNTTSS